MARTRINLPSQSKVTEDLDVANNKIVNLADPVNDYDAVNYKTFKTLQDSVAGAAGIIGEAEDGDYTDGLFTDFTDETPTGTAVDRFNEVLKALSPRPAPTFSSISFDDNGTSGNLSFGSSNVISGYTNVSGHDINQSYNRNGLSKGIFSPGTTMNGKLANNVTDGESDGSPYYDYSFGDADKGVLELYLNGTLEHSVDLSSFNSGNTTNANGSGFNLSQAHPAKFESGQTLDVFKHRTGTWFVTSADQRLGYNFVKVVHRIDSVENDSQEWDFVIDGATDETTFSSEQLSGLNMTGTKQLSGVTYHTGGTASYGVTISNVYRNTYSSSNSAISHSGTNCSASSQSIPSMTSEDDDVVITGKSVTISNNSRILNGSISLNTTAQRTVQSSQTSSGDSIGGILLDAESASSSNTNENFDDENYRLHGGYDVTSTDVTSFSWDSSQSLIGSDANHNDGLLISNSRLSYPSNTSHIGGITDGDFSAPAAGPNGNPDYSTASGTRTYLRYFQFSKSLSNFNLSVGANSTSFVSVATGPSGDNATLEILAPNTTTDGSNVVWKDATVSYDGNDDAVGCYAGTYGSNIPTDWGVTIGTKNTSTSGGYIVVKITVSSTWSGNITSLSLNEA